LIDAFFKSNPNPKSNSNPNPKEQAA
jgi:hypothetical protein